MSIAITTVLPEPVAIFRAMRGMPSLCSALILGDHGAAVAEALGRAAGHLGEEDRRLGGLTLGEEDAVLAVGSAQCRSSLAVVAVAPGYPASRQLATSWRSSLMSVLSCLRRSSTKRKGELLT
jgi:hypothetical protein